MPLPVVWNKQYLVPDIAAALHLLPLANIFRQRAMQFSPDRNRRDVLRYTHEFEPCGQYHVVQHVLRIANMGECLGKAGAWSRGSPDLACDVHVSSVATQKFHPLVSTSRIRIGLE